MRAQYYPKADRTSQWWEDDFDRASFDYVEKLLLHSTETAGWPSYNKSGTPGDSAPTLTYYSKYRKWRQHCKIGSSARALVDPTGTPVRENRDRVVQIEIIGYADEIKADTVSGSVKISELTDDNLRDLGEFYAWLHNEWDAPIRCTLEFPAYRPYKNVRLTSAEYDAYKGMCGHMHASGNTHTDPGNINAGKIIAFATGDIMATLDAEDHQNIAKAVWDYMIKSRFSDQSYRAFSWLEGSAQWAQMAKTASEKSLALDVGQSAALKALADNPNLTPEALSALVEDAVNKVIGEGLSGKVTVDFGDETAPTVPAV